MIYWFLDAGRRGLLTASHRLGIYFTGHQVEEDCVMDEQKKGTLSRRDFGKLGAATTFAVLSSQGASAQNADTLKVGLLGCGGRGTGAAFNMLQGENNVSLIALADVFEDRVSQARERLSGHGDARITDQVSIADDHCFVGLDAYKEILKTDIDILIEATPPYARPKHVAAAVDAGKHIFAEKPVAVDPAGMRQFLAAMQKHKAAGLSFVAGTQRRHHLGYQETIKKLHDGAIGDIVAMRVYWNDELPWAHDRQEGWSDLEYRIRNWYSYCWACGENIVEQHVHNLDIANWVMGDHPVSVYASGGKVWKPHNEKFGDTWDHFSCDFEYPGDRIVFSGCRHWNGFDYEVFEEALGSKGSSRCQDMSDADHIIDPYVAEHQDLLGSIRGTGKKWHQGEEVGHSTFTAIMGRMSAYTGRKLMWDDALNSDLSIVPEDLSFDKDYPLGPVPMPVKRT
jgi:predicted dehydrogenase